MVSVLETWMSGREMLLTAITKSEEGEVAGYPSLNEYIGFRHIVVRALTDGERYRGCGEMM